jgi:TonB family protein
MIPPGNFAAWWVQLALFVSVAAVLVKASRLRHPGALLLYWQGVATVMLLLAPLSRVTTSAPVHSYLIQDQVDSLAKSATSVAPAASWLWCAGVVTVILLARFAAGLVALRRYRRTAVPFPLLTPQQEFVKRLAPNSVVLLHAKVRSPVSYGWRNPVVLLPSSCMQLDAELLNPVLIHELLHLRRGDWLFHITEELLRAALWFHPAIWYCVAQIRFCREQTVDGEVIKITQQQSKYIQALVRAAQLYSGGGAWLPAPPFARKHQLVHRVQHLIHPWHGEKNMTLRKTKITLVALLALLGIAGCITSIAAPLQGAGGKAYITAADGIVEPKIILRKSPVYPPEAKDAHVQGMVKLALKVSTDGLPYDIEVAKSVDISLDQAAINAVQQWRWSPGMKDGKPVIVATEVEITFTLMP